MGRTAKGAPRLNEAEWEALHEFYRVHGAAPGRGELEALGSTLRELRPELDHAHRRPDGLRRQLAAFKVLQDPAASSDTKSAVLAKRVWDRHAFDREPRASDFRRAPERDRGPAPTFGSRTVERVDLESELYLLLMRGPVERVFDPDLLRGRRVAKVGWSNDVRRRVRELNEGFPPGMALGWEVADARPFPNGASAYAAEQRLLDILHFEGSSLGGEFVLLREGEFDRTLARDLDDP